MTNEEIRKIYEEADDNMRKILDAMMLMSKEQLQELIEILEDDMRKRGMQNGKA